MNWQGNSGSLERNSLTSQNVLAGQELLCEVLGFLVGWLARSLVGGFVGQCQNVISIKRIEEKGKITDEKCLRLQLIYIIHI